MYFEGCLGLNVIQQSGLMSAVFAGDPSLLLRITAPPPTKPPNAFIRPDLWVLIQTWIIGYLPPLTFDTRNVPGPTFMAFTSAAEVMGEYTERPRPPHMRKHTCARMHAHAPASASASRPWKWTWVLSQTRIFLILTNYEMVKHSARVSLLHLSRAEPSRRRAAEAPPPALRWSSSIRAGPKRRMLICGKIFLLQR